FACRKKLHKSPFATNSKIRQGGRPTKQTPSNRQIWRQPDKAKPAAASDRNAVASSFVKFRQARKTQIKIEIFENYFHDASELNLGFTFKNLKYIKLKSEFISIKESIDDPFAVDNDEPDVDQIAEYVNNLWFMISGFLENQKQRSHDWRTKALPSLVTTLSTTGTFLAIVILP
uniref:Uncharacterized protein n=1 Tax=Romanomermis culicivorax TaxID=13658 RepID=A0A915JBM2_ROMCU